VLALRCIKAFRVRDGTEADATRILLGYAAGMSQRRD
jgi:hypothetical protein